MSWNTMIIQNRVLVVKLIRVEDGSNDWSDIAS